MLSPCRTGGGWLGLPGPRIEPRREATTRPNALGEVDVHATLSTAHALVDIAGTLEDGDCGEDDLLRHGNELFDHRLAMFKAISMPP